MARVKWLLESEVVATKKMTKGQKVQGKISQLAKKFEIKINVVNPKKTCPVPSFTQFFI
jgi:hypothetical protein